MNCVKGITAEEFIASTKPGQAVVDKTKYDRLRELIAVRLNIAVENVDIFTVLNHPTLSRTIDVRYSAHGSPYYRPSRLDGILSLNKTKASYCFKLVVNNYKLKMVYRVGNQNTSALLPNLPCDMNFYCNFVGYISALFS